MLDIKLIRENPEKVKKGIAAKGTSVDLVDKVLDLDKKWRDQVVVMENLRSERNKAVESKNIESGKKIKSELSLLEPKLDEAKKLLDEALGQLPNLPADDVPVGKNEKDNVEIKKWGTPRKFDFLPKDHLELGTKLGILDFASGSRVSGNNFYFWLGAGALLELALVKYAFDVLSKEGFMPIITPDLVRSRFYLGTGYMPKGNEAQTYTIDEEDLGLIATAEITLAGRHADEVLTEDKLPIKYIGYSHCFRKEAGAYGKYSKGLFMLSLASALRIYPIVLLPLFLIPYIRLRKFKEIIKYSLITISAPFTFFILGNFLGNGSLTELILFYQSSYGPFGIYPILLSIVIIINKFRVSSIDRSVIPFILLSLLFLSQTAIFLLNYKGVINLKKSILISLLLIFLFYPKMHSLYILAVLPISILLENWRVTKSLWIPGTIWALFVNGIEDNRGLPYWFYWLTHYKFSLPEMYNHGITILMSTLYLSLIVICILNILKPSEKPQNNTNTLVN